MDTEGNWKQLMWGLFLILLGGLFLAERTAAWPSWPTAARCP